MEYVWMLIHCIQISNQTRTSYTAAYEVSVCNACILCTYTMCILHGPRYSGKFRPKFNVHFDLFTVCRLHVNWIKFNENCPLIIYFHWNSLVSLSFFVHFQLNHYNYKYIVDWFIRFGGSWAFYPLHALHSVSQSFSSGHWSFNILQ